MTIPTLFLAAILTGQVDHMQGFANDRGQVVLCSAKADTRFQSVLHAMIYTECVLIAKSTGYR